MLLVANQMDRVPAQEREECLAHVAELGPDWRVVPLSAKTGEGVQALLEHLVGLMPLGPKYYPDDWVVDQPEQFIVAELIREKALLLTRDEVPHSVAVEVERMAAREDGELIDIEATILVERDSQRGIIIGKGASRLKEIGTQARREVERLLGRPVNLQLRVKVRRDWREKERALRALGYR